MKAFDFMGKCFWFWGMAINRQNVGAEINF